MQVSEQFIDFLMSSGALRFGEFRSKGGRLSPYFCNFGLFNDGEKLFRLSQFYAEALLASSLHCDMLFGCAYKGIPLVSALASRLYLMGHVFPFAFDRKEEKPHGEGGRMVGAPVQGDVLIVDDVVSSGISAQAAIDLIRQLGGNPVGVLIAFDRMECDRSGEDPAKKFNIPVLSVAKLSNLISVMRERVDLQENLDQVLAYYAKYGKKSAG